MSGDTFNFDNIKIEGGQNQVGSMSGDMHQYNGDEPVTVEEFLDAVASPQALPVEVAEVVMPQIQSFAKLPVEEQTQMIEGESPEWIEIVERIKPHARTIWTNVATFGAAALKTLAARNPVCAGVMAVCQANAAAPDPTEYR